MVGMHSQATHKCIHMRARECVCICVFVCYLFESFFVEAKRIFTIQQQTCTENSHQTVLDEECRMRRKNGRRSEQQAAQRKNNHLAQHTAHSTQQANEIENGFCLIFVHVFGFTWLFFLCWSLVRRLPGLMNVFVLCVWLCYIIQCVHKRMVLCSL